MRRCMPNIAGITWQRLLDDGAVTYPCKTEGAPGDRVEFVKRFPTPTGRARFVPAGIISADEQPDTDYPLVLITGRQLEHWHTRQHDAAFTGADASSRSGCDDESGRHAASRHLARAVVTLESRRGEVSLYARVVKARHPHRIRAVCYAEAAINRLTNPKLDRTARFRSSSSVRSGRSRGASCRRVWSAPIDLICADRSCPARCNAVRSLTR